MRPFALLAVCLFAASAVAQGTPAASFVRPDGTLDLAAAPAGAVDLGGTRVSMGTDGRLRTAAEGEFQDISSGPSGLPLNGSVKALAVAPDGAVYAGGNFTTAGGEAANRVARRTGTAWEALGSGMDGSVNAVAVAADGSVYAGGSFTTAGGVAASGVARWTGTAWEALGSGVNGRVEALVVAPDGSVYAGGFFTTAGGVAARNVARWTGTAWEALGAGVDGQVAALATEGRGDLMIGGYFTKAGDVTSPYATLYDAPRPVDTDDGITTGPSGIAVSIGPNPVSAGGAVRVALAEAGPVRVALYDMLGREVAVLADGVRSAGEHVEALGAERLVPGVYVVRVTAGAASVVRRVTVAR